MPSIYSLVKCAAVFAAAQSGARICDARGVTQDNNLMPEPAGGLRSNDLDLAPSPTPVRTQMKNFPPPVSNRRPPPAPRGSNPIDKAASTTVLKKSIVPSLQSDRDAMVNPPYPNRRPLPFPKKNSRTYSDQADDLPDPQIHAVYAVPDGAIDRHLDTATPGIVNSISSIQYWMANQTEGRWLRYDTADGQADVTYVPLPFSDIEYDTIGQYSSKFREILSDVDSAITFQDHKLYSVYYEGSDPDNCGTGVVLPDETYVLPAAGNVLYLQSTDCFPNDFPTRQDEISSYDFSALHEIIHNMGAVSPGAPDTIGATSYHVDTSYTDIMYTSLDPNARLPARRRVHPSSVLDFNRKNYYNPAGLPNGLVNIADSSFMISPKICNSRTEDCNSVVPPSLAPKPLLPSPPLASPPRPAPLLSSPPPPAAPLPSPPRPAPLLSSPPPPAPLLASPPRPAPSPVYAAAPGPDHSPPSQKSAAFRKSPDPRLVATLVASGAAIVVAAV